MDAVTVGKDGEAAVPSEIVIGRTQDLFGPKIYEITEDIQRQMESIGSTASIEAVDQHVRILSETVRA